MKKALHFMILAALVLATACEPTEQPVKDDDKDEDITIDVTPDAPTVAIAVSDAIVYPYPSTEGGEFTFSVSCASGLDGVDVVVTPYGGLQAEVSLAADKSSGTVKVTAGDGFHESGSVEVTVSNRGGERRQLAVFEEAFVRLDRTSLDVSSESQIQVVTVESNVDYSIEVAPDGDPDIRVESFGEGFTVSFPENTSFEDRTSAVTVKESEGILNDSFVRISQAGFGGSRLTDSLALVQFWKELDGPGWAKMGVGDRRSENWNTDKPLEQWLGVQTNDKTGRVIEISMDVCRPIVHPWEDSDEEHINLPIPECIGDLKELQRLHLCGTFTGGIPESIGKLTKLKELDLSRCNLSGEIPESIGNLANLEDLNLIGNNLSGSLEDHEGLKKICPHLHPSIGLGGHFSGNFPRWLPEVNKTLHLAGDFRISGEIPLAYAENKAMQRSHWYRTPTVPADAIETDSKEIDFFIEKQAKEGYALWVGERPEGVYYNGDHWCWKDGYGPEFVDEEEWPGYYD